MHYYTLYDHIIRYYFDYYQKNVIAATFQQHFRQITSFKSILRNIFQKLLSRCKFFSCIFIYISQRRFPVTPVYELQKIYDESNLRAINPLCAIFISRTLVLLFYTYGKRKRFRLRNYYSSIVKSNRQQTEEIFSKKRILTKFLMLFVVILSCH